MKKINLLFFVLSIFITTGCTKITQENLNLKETFDGLPDFDFIVKKIDGKIVTSFSIAGYQGDITPIDTADHGLLGNRRLQLIYGGKEILNEKCFWAEMRYQDDLVMIIQSDPEISHYSRVYYKGGNITDKLKPKNWPAISNIRLSGENLYLEYYSWINGWYTSAVPASYGRYNLISGDLITEGPELPQ